MPSRPKISCPNCQSTHVRSAKPKDLNELVGEFLGTYCFRCAQCGLQFQHSVFGTGSLIYAKCPKCFRMDLTTWSESHYRPTFWMRVKRMLGAKRVRCEACRCNFVSFRKRQSTYVRPNAGVVEHDNQDSEMASARS